MDLSNDLISKFVKITNDNSNKEMKETTVYGTTVEQGGQMYVKIDGSDLLTPITTTADIQDGERVTIMIKNHSATVTGNVSSPSASTKVVGQVVQSVEKMGDEIAKFDILIADRVSTKELDAEVARIDQLIAGCATIGQLDAANATIKVLDTEVANIQTLVNGNLTSDNIASLNLTSANTTIDNAMIKDAMIDNISAGKIVSGTINTSLVTVQSDDGSMILTGSLQQFKDDNGVVRIQLGKDSSGNFSFILYDETGKGVLLNETGIQSSDAIADGLIVDAKVADDAAISGSKLDIESVVVEVNNSTTTIKSNKIYLDNEQQTLDVSFDAMKTATEENTDRIESNTTSLEIQNGQISTLISENEIIQTELSELSNETSEISTKYSLLEQDVDEFKVSVGETYATKEAVHDINTNLTTNYSTTEAMTATINMKADEISSSVSATYATKEYVDGIVIEGVEGVTEAQMNSAINQKADEITASVSATYATKDEMNSAISVKADEISTSVSETYATIETVNDLSGNLSENYSTTEAMNSAINQKANEITQTVSVTYTTKNEFDSLTIGGTNLYLNSNFATPEGYGYITDGLYYDYVKSFDNPIITAKYGGSILYLSHPGTETTNDNFMWLSRDVTLEPNTTYTLSYDYMSAGDITGNSSYIELDTEDRAGENAIYIPCGVDTQSVKVRERYVKTFTTTSTHYIFQLRFGFINTGNAWLAVEGIKLEKGNKATEWSPAPEDIVNNLSENYSTTSAMNSAINQKADEITQTVSSTYATKETVNVLSNNLTENYSTTSAMNSAINQKANEITSSVSETYTTKNEFNNLSVGGTNLYPNSNFAEDATHMECSPNAHITFATTIDNGNVVSRYGRCLQIYAASGGSVDIYYTLTPLIQLEPNTTYTLSFDWFSTYGVSQNSGYIYLWGAFGDVSTRALVPLRIDHNTDKQREKQVITFTTDTVHLTFQLRFGFVLEGAAAWLTIDGIKLEKGNKATDWSPAPEDILDTLAKNYSTTEAMNSAINQKANEITQTVSSTYTTKTEFDALNIGSTNLVMGTKDFSGWDYNSNYMSKSNEADIDSRFTGMYIHFEPSTASVEYVDLAKGRCIWVEPDTEYTLSFWARGNGEFHTYLWMFDNSPVAYHYNSSGYSGTNGDGASKHTLSSNDTYKRYWVVYKTRPTVQGTANLIVTRLAKNLNATNTAMVIYGVKFEKGNKPTDWSPAPEDVDNSINSLASRVSTAESKLTKDSLTTTIGSYYTTANDVDNQVASKGYATQSQVTQTVDSLTAKFSSTNAYNLIRNSTGAGRNIGWSGNVKHALNYDTPRSSGVSSILYLQNTDATSNEIFAFSTRFALKEKTTYTLSGWFYKNPGVTSYDIFVLASNTVYENEESSTSYSNIYYDGTHHENQSWQYITYTFTTDAGVRSGYIRIDNNGYTGSGDTANLNVHWCGLMLNEGSVALPWSPHPSETYSTTTTIDKEGVRVEHASYGGYTQIRGNGLYVSDGIEQVIVADASGVKVKGQVTVTGGSISGSTKIDGGGITTNTINGSSIKTDSITANQIAAGAITASEIASRTITASKIATGTITANEIAANTITTDKLSTSVLQVGNITSAPYQSKAYINLFGSMSIDGSSGALRFQYSAYNYYYVNSDSCQMYISGDQRFLLQYDNFYVYCANFHSRNITPQYGNSYNLGYGDYGWQQIKATYGYFTDCQESSDIKLKENVYILPKDNTEDTKAAMRKVNGSTLDKRYTDVTLEDLYSHIKDDLEIASFNFMSTGKGQIGFIANDVQPTKVGALYVDTSDTGDTLTYSNGSYTSVIAGALQYEIRKRDKQIAELLERIEKLEGDN